MPLTPIPVSLPPPSGGPKHLEPNSNSLNIPVISGRHIPTCYNPSSSPNFCQSPASHDSKQPPLPPLPLFGSIKQLSTAPLPTHTTATSRRVTAAHDIAPPLPTPAISSAPNAPHGSPIILPYHCYLRITGISPSTTLTSSYGVQPHETLNPPPPLSQLLLFTARFSKPTTAPPIPHIYPTPRRTQAAQGNPSPSLLQPKLSWISAARISPSPPPNNATLWQHTTACDNTLQLHRCSRFPATLVNSCRPPHSPNSHRYTGGAREQTRDAPNAVIELELGHTLYPYSIPL